MPDRPEVSAAQPSGSDREGVLDPSVLTHDVLRGVLNGVTFDEYDDLDAILPICCESCGAPIYLGVIVSTCGDTDQAVWEDDPAIDGYSKHRCGKPPMPDMGDCPICYGDDEADDERELAGVLGA